MKNYEQSNNRFQLSGRHPSEYPIGSNEDAICVDIAKALGEPSMRYILARRHQLGIGEIEAAYAIVKDEMRKGTCRNPRKLFNALLTKKWHEKNGD